MNDERADGEREEIEKLLPWYVTGRLERTDQRKVESYLALHPDIAAQLDLIRAEREETVRANEALSSPSGMRRLTAALPAARLPLPGPWPSHLAAFFTRPTARGVRWAALVAGILLLAQAAVIAGLLVGNGILRYQVASGPSPSNGQSKGESKGQSSGLALLIGFTDEASAPAIARLLAEFDARIVDGPKAGGIYRIRVPTGEWSQRAQDALLRRLAERRDLVRIVLPSRE